MSTTRDQERLRARLRANAQDLGRVEREKSKARAKRTDLILQARVAGISVIEIAEIFGLTRRAIYDVIDEASNRRPESESVIR